MQNKSQIGVCVDYSIAYILEEKNEEKVITIIEAQDESNNFNVVDDNSTIKKRPKDHVFFKKVFEIIKDFDKVLLFGPTSVKNELMNRINAHKLFNIEILNRPSQGVITDTEKIDFINNYFENKFS